MLQFTNERTKNQKNKMKQPNLQRNTPNRQPSSSFQDYHFSFLKTKTTRLPSTNFLFSKLLKNFQKPRKDPFFRNF